MMIVLTWFEIHRTTLFFGSPMYILSQKLKHLKNNLIEWNKNVFGNIHEHLNIAEQEVQRIQA